MNGFLGTYSVSLDDKGRLNVPVKFRTLLEHRSPKVVVSVGKATMGSGYLKVFSQPEWGNEVKKLSHLSAFDEENQKKLREIYPNAAECEIKSGKILIPIFQREAAGLQKEVWIKAMGNRFYLWDPNRWEKENG